MRSFATQSRVIASSGGSTGEDVFVSLNALSQNIGKILCMSDFY